MLNMRYSTTVVIGCSGKTVSLSRAPGWEPESYGYHGDDGHVFASQSVGKSYGPKYGPGDTVGCLVNFRTGTINFTKNGDDLGKSFCLSSYARVCFCDSGVLPVSTDRPPALRLFLFVTSPTCVMLLSLFLSLGVSLHRTLSGMETTNKAAGIAFRDGALRETKGRFFPTIGLKKPGDHVFANFGQMPFQFDIDGYVKVI